MATYVDKILKGTKPAELRDGALMRDQTSTRRAAIKVYPATTSVKGAGRREGTDTAKLITTSVRL